MMDEFQRKKFELIKPLLLEAGAALMDCQQLEYGIALLLFHLSRLGVSGLDPVKIKLILDDQEKRTAGQLITMLKQKVTISEGIEVSLQEALDARNRIIHRFIIDNIEKVLIEDQRLQMVKDLKVLRSKVQKADKQLRPFINMFSEKFDSVASEQLEEEIKKALG